MMNNNNSRIDILFDEIDKIIVKEKHIPIIIPFLTAILYSSGIIVLFISLLIPNQSFYNVTYVNQISSFYSVYVSFAAFISSIYLVYKWINVRNEHFIRSTKVYSIITDIEESLGSSKVYLLKSRFNELSIINNDKKGIAVNITLSIIIPFYVLYVYHFMNKDFSKHSTKEKLLLTELIDDIRSKDDKFVRNIIDYKVIEERSTFLYIILTIITLGIFLLYWAYAITRDYNEHIDNHRMIDNDIITGLRRIAGK